MRSQFLRRAASVALVLVAAFSASACDQGHEGSARVAVIGDSLEVVDPAAGPLTTPQAVLLTNVAQGLVRFDARGQIVPGLAERWNVSDDGLSYIFRLAAGEWPNGDRITAEQVARILRRQLSAGSDNALKDTLGAVDEVVAMTDRVVEIRLTAPRSNLLQLLAQPEFALVRDGQGTGPLRMPDNPDGGKESEEPEAGAGLRLVRDVPIPDSEETRPEEVTLAAADARAAIAAFKRGETDLVLGGSFVDLPLARAAELADDALQFDPASGLFGLVPARDDGPIADEEFRRLLSQAIDREALVAAFDVPGLLPRATLLGPGLDGMPNPVAPQWTATPLAERRPALAAAADRLFADEEERPVLRIALPQGPGADLLLRRLASDWSVLGIRVERAASEAEADLRLVDMVAPSSGPAWFLRQFRCDQAEICSEPVDELLEAARAATVAAQRNALLAEAAVQADEAQLYLPLTAPIRWSLVSARIEGFAPNRFARHPLTALADRLNRERAE